MRAISDERIEVFEDVAVEAVAQIRAYFKYQGDDPRYMQKAKAAAAVIGAYSRLRASETNRMAVDLASGKQAAIVGKAQAKQLGGGGK